MKKLLALTVLISSITAGAAVSCNGNGVTIEEKNGKLEILAGDFKGLAVITKTSVTEVYAQVKTKEDGNFLRASVELDDEDSQLIIHDSEAHIVSFDVNCE